MPGKRELISPRGRKRYLRRTATGRFGEDQTSVGRSLTQDQRRKAKTTAAPGYGDKGDRRSRPRSAS
jgi:hypothetical protein